MTTQDATRQRLEVCRRCPRWAGQCQLGHDTTGLAGCPIGRFQGFVPLGNVAAAVFKPIAQLVHLKCRGCTTRQDTWNHVVTR